jgi:hypothetical protein
MTSERLAMRVSAAIAAPLVAVDAIDGHDDDGRDAFALRDLASQRLVEPRRGGSLRGTPHARERLLNPRAREDAHVAGLLQAGCERGVERAVEDRVARTVVEVGSEDPRALGIASAGLLHPRQRETEKHEETGGKADDSIRPHFLPDEPKRRLAVNGGPFAGH